MKFLMPFLLTALVFAAPCSRSSPPVPVKASVSVEMEQQSRATQGASDIAPLRLPLVNPRIVVLKSKRQLLFYSDNRVVRTYRIGLGFNPVNDKIKEGDGATPEGDFYIFTKNAKSSFHLSLGLSYPNADDAKRGLREGLVTQAQHDQIVKAVRSKIAPPQNTPLGGQIYIHGNGAQRDWTRGCVALDDKDVEELFNAVPVGTEVTVQH